jgi:hypothetical protein
MNVTATKAPAQAESAQSETAARKTAVAQESPQQIPLWADAALPAIQFSLKVNTPGDQYEQEADRVANRVMRMSEPTVQRKSCACGRPAGPDGMCEDCKRKQLGIQRMAKGEGDQTAAPPIVHQVLQQPGRPLDSPTRNFMEARFGQDFGGVRVHTDGMAANSADSVNGRAYTVGQDMVFGAGQYQPETAMGRKLLAHELTHTIQQGRDMNRLQRALKFELQTRNYVWRVDNIGTKQSVKLYKPNTALLPRKYSPSGGTEERGDRPAYLSTGHRGGPARPKRYVSFVEAKGLLTMEEATKGIDTKKGAQIIREYKFKTQVKVSDILKNSVAVGQLTLVSEIDNSLIPAMAGKFNPNTFEFKYLNADGTPLDVHLGPDRKFAPGHVKYMEVGRTERTDIDENKKAQYEEVWKITEDSNGDVDFLGKQAKVEQSSIVNNANVKGMENKFNPNTWEKNYYKASDFDGNKLKPGAKRLKVHRAKDGSFKKKHIKFMEAEPLKEAEEQTAIELQSENHGVLEFETPKWFKDWTDLAIRIQEAVDMTKAIDNSRQLKETPSDTADAKILNDMKAKIGDKDKPKSLIGSGERRLGLADKVVEWPKSYSTSHLKGLGNRRLLVEIVDKKWVAFIQSSEAIALSQYESLAKEHEIPLITTEVPVIELANGVIDSAIKAAKTKNKSLSETLFADLRGFLQLIMTYITRGQIVDRSGTYAKGAFRLMARTDFGSMYQELLGDEEKALFISLVTDKSDPILKSLEGPINAARVSRVDAQNNPLAPITLTRNSPFFFRKVGTNAKTATYGPKIYDWMFNMTKGKDLLAGPSISDAMGAKSVKTELGNKDYKRALFEVRGTASHGGRTQNRDHWLEYAKNIFDAAAARSLDTPDDPTTAINEASKTGLKKKAEKKKAGSTTSITEPISKFNYQLVPKLTLELGDEKKIGFDADFRLMLPSLLDGKLRPFVLGGIGTSGLSAGGGLSAAPINDLPLFLAGKAAIRTDWFKSVEIGGGLEAAWGIDKSRSLRLGIGWDAWQQLDTDKKREHLLNVFLSKQF